MMEHSTRAHAFLSASGAHRWLSCPPSALLEAEFPATSSRAADEGTLAHELAELKVKHYVHTDTFGRRAYNAAVKKLKAKELWADEMEGYTDEYLDYIRKTALAFRALPYVEIEKRLDLSEWVPGGFGTADCIMICAGVLHIIDLKYGKNPQGRVSAVSNPQMMLYALGTWKTCRLFYQIDTVRLTIVQPRLPNGISEWECSLEGLRAFGSYVKERAALAVDGKGDFAPSEQACRWCRAKGKCTARAVANTQLSPIAGTDYRLLTPEQIGEYLSRGATVAAWLKDLQDAALADCLAGKHIPGWKAVEGRGLRAWTDGEAAFKALTDAGIDEAVLYERKPLTLAQVEDVVGKKDFAKMVGAFVTKAQGKPTLVPETDKREAINNVVSAAEAFRKEEQ